MVFPLQRPFPQCTNACEYYQHMKIPRCYTHMKPSTSCVTAHIYLTPSCNRRPKNTYSTCSEYFPVLPVGTYDVFCNVTNTAQDQTRQLNHPSMLFSMALSTLAMNITPIGVRAGGFNIFYNLKIIIFWQKNFLQGEVIHFLERHKTNGVHRVKNTTNARHFLNTLTDSYDKYLPLYFLNRNAPLIVTNR